MKNPSRNICIFSFEGEVLEKYGGGNRRLVIPITFSKSGVARAWYGYADTSLAKAGGYGYDKESTALAGAIEKLTGKNIEGNAAGWAVVVASAKKQGLSVDKIF